MRILYVVRYVGIISGGHRWMFSQCNELAKLGHDVAVWSYMGDADGAVFFPLAVPRLNDATAFLRHTDAVIFTEWSLAQIVAGLVGPRKHYLVQMRDDLIYPEGQQRRRAAKSYDLPLHCITIAHWLREFLAAEHGHRDVPLVSPWINPETFYPDPAWPRGERFRVLIEGPEHVLSKNLADAHTAVAGLPVEVWGFNADTEPTFRYHYDRFVVAAPPAGVRRIMGCCDVMLKTSRYEGRPGTVVEAMACGLPVVATDFLGTDDLIHEHNCLLVPYGDVVGARAAVERLMKEPDLRRYLSENGLRYVREHLTVERNLPLFLAALGV